MECDGLLYCQVIGHFGNYRVRCCCITPLMVAENYQDALSDCDSLATGQELQRPQHGWSDQNYQ